MIYPHFKSLFLVCPPSPTIFFHPPPNFGKLQWVHPPLTLPSGWRRLCFSSNKTCHSISQLKNFIPQFFWSLAGYNYGRICQKTFFLHIALFLWDLCKTRASFVITNVLPVYPSVRSIRPKWFFFLLFGIVAIFCLNCKANLRELVNV